jgi:F-type H+-transporting ATPase subunit beta
MKNVGKITQVIGPVVDVEFAEGLPRIYDALEIKLNDKEKLVLETHQHTGGNKVRAVAMGSTDGLKRGMEVVDTGAAISVPVGAGVLGRMFNLLGGRIRSTEMRQALPSNRHRRKFSKQVSKLSTLSVLS